MKYYSISFPGEYGQHVEEIWSEEQILRSYFLYWTTMMVKAGKGDLVSEKQCIEDWTIVHWANEVPKPAWITE